MTTIASGTYIGATAADLRTNTAADKAAGAISQKALFRHRGDITLTDEALTLSGWSGTDSGLVLRRADIAAITRKYTKLYGRFMGGLLNSGKPLILATATTAGEIYLLIDRKELMETTRNARWEQALESWRTQPFQQARG
jgi:hypothetical protein